MQSTLDELNQLTRGMLKRKMFVVMAEPVESADDGQVDHVSLLSEHLRYLIDLEQQNAIFAAGPFLENGQPGKRSMYVLRAGSIDEARAIMADEPFQRHGLRTCTVQEWSLSEGRISVSVDFSTQRAGLDGPPSLAVVQ